MKLCKGCTYDLTCSLGGKVSRYNATVDNVTELDYDFTFEVVRHEEYDNHVLIGMSNVPFTLDYSVEHVHENLENGTWVAKLIQTPHSLPSDLFEV